MRELVARKEKRHLFRLAVFLGGGKTNLIIYPFLLFFRNYYTELECSSYSGLNNCGKSPAGNTLLSSAFEGRAQYHSVLTAAPTLLSSSPAVVDG